MSAITASLLLLAPTLAWASPGDASRPDEGAMFGGGEPAPVATPASPDRDSRELAPAHEAHKDAFSSGEVSDNPLQIGGKYYQRFVVSGQKGQGAGKAPISAPLQFDGFLDGRPNDQLRAFVDARLFHDATRSTSAGSLEFSSSSTAPTDLGSSAPASNNPSVALDQAWLKFDMNRAVFATVGKQHVKWGASRFWNPTDFLHVQRRDPLLPYDLRLGSTMAKFELPWQSHKANLYAIALLDNPQPASTLGQMGGAFRAEKVWGDLEVGLDFIARGSRQPVYGLDASTSLGPLDVYLEGALLNEAASPQYTVNGSYSSGADVSSLVTAAPQKGPFAQVSGGTNYTFGWKENRQATIGVEYFYNQAGYSDAHVYPALIFFGQYQPFYTGRHYAALYLTAEGPDEQKKTSYTLSTLGNFSDKSFISRLDFAWRVLTYLSFEANVSAHYGTEGGEFNFALSTPNLTYHGVPVSAVNVPATVFDLGLGLRMSL